jgi:hypothetical protein
MTQSQPWIVQAAEGAMAALGPRQVAWTGVSHAIGHGGDRGLEDVRSIC